MPSLCEGRGNAVLRIHKLGRTGLALTGLLLGTFALTGCAEGIPQRDPELPPGFADYLLPDVDINGYIYIQQAEPFVIPISHFADEELLGELGEVPQGLGELAQALGVELGIPEQLELDLLSLIVGPEVENAFGALFEFAQDSHAAFAVSALEQEALEERPWYLQRGTELFVSPDKGGWIADFQDAVTSGQRVRLEDKYEDAWRAIRMLPEDAPGEPIAAGFVRVDRVLLEALAERAEVDIGILTPALGVIRIRTASFAVYSDGPVQLPEEATEAYFRSAGLSAVYIARSGYPSFLLSFFFDNFADRVGMEKVTLSNGETALHVQMEGLEGLHLVVKNLGSTIVFTLAADQQRAEELMASTIP